MIETAILRELGLTDGEIRVYIALLELEDTTIGPIITKGHVSSSKVYIILERLIDKGLVTYITKDKTKYFQPASPTSLQEYMAKKEQEFNKIKQKVPKVIMQLEEIRNSKQAIEGAKIYKGYNGLKAAWYEALKNIPDQGEYYFFSVGYGNDPYLQRFFKQVAIYLKKRKITIKGIAHTKEKTLYKSYYKKLGYIMKYTNMEWPSDMTIAGNCLLMLVWDKKEPVVYAIQSEILALSYLFFLKKIWTGAKQ